MSTDDYFDDDEDDDLNELEAASDTGAATDGSAAASGSVRLGQWLSRRRGWVLMFSLVFIQGLFGVVMLFMKADSRPASQEYSGAMNDLAVEMLGHQVEIGDVYQYLPIRGGKRVSIGMEVVLVLGQLPEERIEGSDKPTDDEFALFITAIQDMEPRIRSRLNTLIQRIPVEHYTSTELVEDYARIKKDLADYVNDSLDGLDFGKGVRRNIGKRRVTEVLIPVFLRQIK